MCSVFRTILLVIDSAKIIMLRCVALCLVLGMLAVSGASAATRQAYSPSAQALVREVVSTLKVRSANSSPCTDSRRNVVVRLHSREH